MAMTARELALSVLTKCGRDEAYSNITLDAALKKCDLSPADRALAACIVYGVIERRMTLDYYISKLSTLPMNRIEPQVLNIARMGLYQLAFLDRIPAHAAVNESVSLCPPRARGFVNALLRSFLRAECKIALPSDTLEKMSVEYSVPRPLCERIVADYGENRAKSVLAALNDNPRINLRVNTLKTDREKLLSELTRRRCDAEPSAIVPDGVTVGDGAVTGLYGFDDGLFFVQDAASQLCVEALGAMPGETVIDVCSAPGSKSFGCAMRMENRGRIISCDLHDNKLSLINNGAERLGVKIIETLAGDARNYNESLGGIADRVICDVPCSGYGVIAKKPEIRYKSIEKCAALPDIQLAILENSSRYVRAGGVLVYSTCTILNAENGANVRRFLEKHPEFEPEGFEVCGKAYDAMTQLLPDATPTDGFFIARLKKRAD